jgi:hypothetical protein
LIVLIFQDNVEGMDDSGNVAKNCEQDIDEEVCSATALEEHSKRRQEDGEENLQMRVRKQAN